MVLSEQRFADSEWRSASVFPVWLTPLEFQNLRLARIERGLTRIKATEMKGMCSIFNIPPSYFFAAWEIQGVPKSNASPPLDDAI